LINSIIRQKQNPILIGGLSGMFPAIFYSVKNFGLVYSSRHLLFFTICFVIIPIIISVVVNTVLSSYKYHQLKQHWNPFFSFVYFFGSINFLNFGGKLELLLYPFILLGGIVFSYGFKAHFSKFLFFQFLLTVYALCKLGLGFFNYTNFSSEWKTQNDDIEQIKLIHRPNIYLFQPDGYVNFSEIDKGYYNIDNSVFENYLTQKGFINYDGFRSNYFSTLTSNSSLFMMKHHHYFYKPEKGDLFNYRKHIITENTVLSILKNNNYQTHYIVENPYILANVPKLGFDSVNISYDEFGPLYQWGEPVHDVYEDFLTLLNHDRTSPQFYFVEFYKPFHVSVSKKVSKGKEKEREQWIDQLKEANNLLVNLVDSVLEKDPNALIIILGDHGGYVGFDYTKQIKTKTLNRDLIYSAFSAQLSILWPSENLKQSSPEIKSTVNVFRHVFSNLAEDPKYTKHLEPNESWNIVFDKEEKGIFKYIDENGEIDVSPIR
jgi:hypothetical protein